MKRPNSVSKSWTTIICLLIFFSLSSSLPAQHIQLKSSIVLPGAWEVCAQGNYVYVTALPYGLYVVDVTNPASPMVVAHLDTIGQMRDVKVRGDYAYIAGHIGETGPGFFLVVNISDGANPVIVANLPLSEMAFKVAINYYLAAVTTINSGVRIIDISDPANPVLRSNYRPPGFVQDLYFDEYFLFLARGFAGIQIADAIDPDSVVLVSQYDTPNEALDVMRIGSYVYIADGDSGLQIINIRDISSPVFVSHYQPPDRVFSLAGNGYFMQLAVLNSGLDLVNISNVCNPRQVETYDTPENAWKLWENDSLTYVLDDQNLMIFAVHGSFCNYVPGDINNNGITNGIDVVYAIIFFKGNTNWPSQCECTPGHTFAAVGDVNGSCSFNGLDVIYLCRYLSGAVPLIPCPDCPPDE